MTVTAGLALLVYALVNAVNVGWGSSATLLMLAGAAVLLVAFLLIELRSRAPLMPFSIFRLRTLRGANVVGLLIGMSLFSMFFFISLYLQQVLHYSALKPASPTCRWPSASSSPRAWPPSRHPHRLQAGR